MDLNDHRLISEATVAVFDFDGTLARFDLDWLGLKVDLSALAESHGYSGRFLTTFHPDLAQVRELGGEEVFADLCATIGDQEGAGFRPGTVNAELVDLMVARSAADLPTAIFSANSHAGISTALEHPSFRGVRPFVIGREDVVRGKPDPEGLLTIAAHFGVKASEIVFVGDAPDDFASAEAAGAVMIPVEKIPL